MDSLRAVNCNVANCLPEKSNWCRIEQVCHGVKCKARGPTDWIKTYFTFHLFPFLEPLSPSGCRVDQFSCVVGGCIRLTAKCDGYNDCSDGSDEDNCGTCVGCPRGIVVCSLPCYTALCTVEWIG